MVNLTRKPAIIITVVALIAALIVTMFVNNARAEAAPSPKPAAQKLVVNSTSGHGQLNRRTGKPVRVNPAAKKGTSSLKSAARGCRYVWVQNVAHNLLGSTAYKLKIQTNWCFNRATRRISDVHTKQWVLYVSSQWRYRGLKSSDIHYYDWAKGTWPRSGHKHYRLILFENCILKYGCIGADYSRQVIRVHSNGTATWATDGDAS